MIRKFLEAFFRHKLLILLPIVLTPAVVTPAGFYFVRPYYESSSVVWVGRPTYLRSVDEGGGWWATPAQIETGRIVDLLRTRAFMVEMARRTDLASMVGNDPGEADLMAYIGRSVGAGPTGTNLLTIWARADHPQLAFQMTNALVEAYRERRTAERMEQATLGISFYETRLHDAQQELDKATTAIRRYVAANPRLTTIDPNRGAASTAAARLGLPPIAIDPQLAELIRRVDAEQKDVDTIRSTLDQARIEIAASMEGQDVSFRIVDAARVPSAAVSQRRRLAIFPAAGLVVGLGLGAGLLVALVVADRSLRSLNDLPPHVRVARAVPFLQVRRLPQGLRPITTRQAIGYVAGAPPQSLEGAR
jgi:capsular polysaccharide biosynthesis protein